MNGGYGFTGYADGLSWHNWGDGNAGHSNAKTTQISLSRKTTAVLIPNVPTLPPDEAKHVDRLSCEAACDLNSQCAVFVWKPAETLKCQMFNSSVAMYVTDEHEDDLSKRPAAYVKACGKGCGEVLPCESDEAAQEDNVYESCTKTPTKTTGAYKINPLKESGVFYNVICDFGEWLKTKVTLNPNKIFGSGQGGGLFDGNLRVRGASNGASQYYGASSTMSIPTTGKWAFKTTIGPETGNIECFWGIQSNSEGQPVMTTYSHTSSPFKNFFNTAEWYNAVIFDSLLTGIVRRKFNGGTNTVHFDGPNDATRAGDEIEFLVDRDAGTVDIKINGVTYGSQLTGLPSSSYTKEAGNTNCGSMINRKPISDKATCEAAAKSMGLDDVVATEYSSSNYPPGCFWKGSSLYYSTLSTSTRPCTFNGANFCLCITESTVVWPFSTCHVKSMLFTFDYTPSEVGYLPLTQRTEPVTFDTSNQFATSTMLTFSKGNLRMENAAGAGMYDGATATAPVPTTGKWAFKIKTNGPDTGNGCCNDCYFGIGANTNGGKIPLQSNHEIWHTMVQVTSLYNGYVCVLIVF